MKLKHFVVLLFVIMPFVISDLCRGSGIEPPVGIALGGTGTAYAADGGPSELLCKLIWLLRSGTPKWAALVGGGGVYALPTPLLLAWPWFSQPEPWGTLVKDMEGKMTESELRQAIQELRGNRELLYRSTRETVFLKDNPEICKDPPAGLPAENPVPVTDPAPQQDYGQGIPRAAGFAIFVILAGVVVGVFVLRRPNRKAALGIATLIAILAISLGPVTTAYAEQGQGQGWCPDEVMRKALVALGLTAGPTPQILVTAMTWENVGVAMGYSWSTMDEAKAFFEFLAQQGKANVSLADDGSFTVQFGKGFFGPCGGGGSQQGRLVNENTAAAAGGPSEEWWAPEIGTTFATQPLPGPSLGLELLAIAVAIAVGMVIGSLVCPARQR